MGSDPSFCLYTTSQHGVMIRTSGYISKNWDLTPVYCHV